MTEPYKAVDPSHSDESQEPEVIEPNADVSQGSEDETPPQKDNVFERTRSVTFEETERYIDAPAPVAPKSAPAAPDIAESDRHVNVSSTPPARTPKPPGMPISWKIIVLITFPILAALIILMIWQHSTKEVTQYKTELLGVGEDFIRKLAADDIAAAYNMLMPDVQDRIAAEVVESDYRKAAAGLGAFVSIGKYDWGKAPKAQAPTSFTARFNFEKGAIVATLSFRPVRMGSADAQREYRISDFTFKPAP